MSEKRQQTLANHAKIDPWFHYFLAPVLLACFIASIVFLFNGINALHIWLAVFSLVALLLCFRTRIYSLKVQDRVIRLEERLRLYALLPESLKAKIPGLSERQLIALRFAADQELPIAGRKDIEGEPRSQSNQESHQQLAAGLLAGVKAPSVYSCQFSALRESTLNRTLLTEKTSSWNSSPLRLKLGPAGIEPIDRVLRLVESSKGRLQPNRIRRHFRVFDGFAPRLEHFLGSFDPLLDRGELSRLKIRQFLPGRTGQGVVASAR